MYLWIYVGLEALSNRRALPIRVISIYNLPNDKFRQITSKNPTDTSQKNVLPFLSLKDCEKQPPTQRTKRHTQKTGLKFLS